MSLLTKALPDRVYVGGLKYKINTDYRYVLMFEKLMRDNKTTDREKTYTIMQLFYDDQYIVDLNDAIEQILWFHRCGKEIIKKDEDNDKNIDIIYDFEEDADYIYSGFLECYGIDLTEIKMHWWKFKALFNGLSEETMMKKIMHYRSVIISSDMSDSQQKFYKKMKNTFALPDMRTEEEKEKDFADALCG